MSDFNFFLCIEFSALNIYDYWNFKNILSDLPLAWTQHRLGRHVSGKASRGGGRAFSKGTGGGSALLLDQGGQSGVSGVPWRAKGRH